MVVNVPDVFTQDNVKRGSSLKDYHAWLDKVREEDRKIVKKEFNKIRFFKYHQSDKYKAYQKKYQQSDKFKAYVKRYLQSDKFKAYVKRYLQSDKYKASRKRYQQSDKYKAYQKAYYRKHKKVRV